MLISICGTHSSGKTTLAKEFSKISNFEYKQTDVSKDLLKNLNIENLDKLETSEYEKKLQFQFGMLKNLSLKSETIQNIITDGNPISCIPYGKKLLNNSNDFKEIKKEALKNYNNFDKTFFLPLEIDFEDDDFRLKDLKFRQKVNEELFKEILKKDNVKILTGTVDDRINLILKELNIQSFSNRSNHVVFEGINNSGKTTIMNYLIKYLEENNRDYYFIDRPANPNNKVIENLETLYDNPSKNRKKLLNSYLQDVSYFHNQENVEEKVKTKKLVLADRQKFSAIALGVALGYSLSEMYYLTRHLPTPGTVIYFDIDTNNCLLRASKEKPLYNFRSNPDLQIKINDTFKLLSKFHSEIKVVDANQNADKLYESVLNIIKEIK